VDRGHDAGCRSRESHSLGLVRRRLGRSPDALLDGWSDSGEGDATNAGQLDAAGALFFMPGLLVVLAALIVRLAGRADVAVIALLGGAAATDKVCHEQQRDDD
jgi:hypothetical protein